MFNYMKNTPDLIVTMIANNITRKYTIFARLTYNKIFDKSVSRNILLALKSGYVVVDHDETCTDEYSITYTLKPSLKTLWLSHLYTNPRTIFFDNDKLIKNMITSDIVALHGKPLRRKKFGITFPWILK